MAEMTKYCPDCGSCPNVAPVSEKCPDCGGERLQSVYELAVQVQELHTKLRGIEMQDWIRDSINQLSQLLAEQEETPDKYFKKRKDAQDAGKAEN